MAYKITRKLDHIIGNTMNSFTNWVTYEVTYDNMIQPLYTTLSESDYYEIINEFISLIEPLSSWGNFFIGSPGFIGYSYNFNGIPEYPSVTDFTQEFLFDNKESYAAWQVQENAKGNIRLSNWALSLEEKSTDFSNTRIEGKQLINLANGTISDMSVIKYLITKYGILRETQLSVIHSIVE